MIANIQDLGGWEFGQGMEGGERAGVNYNLEFSYAGKGIANSSLSDEPLVGKRNQENTVAPFPMNRWVVMANEETRSWIGRE
jgi:hypothetical protein